MTLGSHPINRDGNYRYCVYTNPDDLLGALPPFICLKSSCAACGATGLKTNKSHK